VDEFQNSRNKCSHVQTLCQISEKRWKKNISTFHCQIEKLSREVIQLFRHPNWGLDR
jgi:hypothetical protein